jgi:antitoxin component of MazEF toxin-antitoxin module
MVIRPYEYRKVQGMAGDDCLGLVIPSKYARQLGLEKGDFVRISKEGSKVIFEKVS